MNNQELLALRYQLEVLAIDFWHDVDANGGRNAASYYVEDALFATSIREYRGRTAIHEFYNRRERRGARVSLHLVQNFRIEPQGADRVRCEYVMSLFAADGEPPLPSRPAIMIAIAEELAVRQPDGRWLYQSRRLKPLFRDDTPTTG
ncbi:nuclear transport factor 2 family protein [Caenimonas terrae]|uniref:Nuclear transport factor 2 family protein n=1 Tax=Caenimonas terrae TaxID=696074 RepID=A0ABW0NGW7_9BURK